MEIMDSGESFLHWDRNLSEISENGDHDNGLYGTHFSEFLDDLTHDALLGQLLSDPFLSGVRDGMEVLESGQGGVMCGRGCGGGGDDDDDDLSPCSPQPPHVVVEHSYSLCGDSRPQSPLSHLTGEQEGEEGEVEGGDSGEWPMEQEEDIQSLLAEAPSFLPALTLALAESHAAAQGPAAAPLSEPPSPAAASPHQNHHKGKTIKIKEESVIPQIKLEPHEVDQFLNLSPKGLEALHMPPTPPSSHGSDSEGSQSPVHAPPGLSCPPSPGSPGGSPAPSPGPSETPTKASTRAPSSLSNSPLLTAPHKLQGSGPLMLTEEERRTLVAEGYPVPNKLPLTKAEEKALKKIRRKIKNKISAQESRRKKKEYMDALEKKVENCSNENHELRRKVDNLECTNKSLLQQLQALQAAVVSRVPRSCRVAGTQTSSCLMVVVLCFAVFLGNFYPSILSPSSSITESSQPGQQLALKESYTATVKSRSLLSTFEDEQPHLLGLGGEYPDQWEDTPAVVMAAWRRSEQNKMGGPASNVAESHTPLRSNNNDTQSTENLRMDLQRSLEPWLNESSSGKKVLALDRTVNETS
ncbi:cyclic AMP-responsive element-binding protein 3-like protein 2 [Gadus macrocephalus]|uniref:cyclic AMP-responsive element-binding protein 3-like protein 2 n=1 Tax=Gadus macrocephalus TaxID=80720 RepID=UPI0028CB294F|nr:cyclic AMP-responsive element-binding protein 3-like protein 2 [Gadus macrocephalus]